ncbi:MAG: hypothetical protein PHN31_01275 [Candidatus Gracilibacteria bacterium]|nr:hypothetical protein [Candidatus Gracilibacteria bacterium]
MLNKIKTKIKSILSIKAIKRNFVLTGLTFIVFFVFYNTGFAATTQSSNGEVVDTINSGLKALNYLIGISASLIGGLSAVISILIDPTVTNGTAFSLTTYLRGIWVFVSNMVYFIFAGILISISFMNIIGKGTGDTFEIKKALPKLIVGILIVPFSWFLVQFMLSLSSVLTISVFSLPFETFQNNITALNGSVNWCNKLVIDIQGNLTLPENNNTTQQKTGSGFLYCEKYELTPIMDILTGKSGSNNVNGMKSYKLSGLISYYTFGIMELGEIDKLKSGNIINGISSIPQLTAKVAFDIIFLLIYLIILIALFLALFVRLIRIWLYTVFSPVFGLTYFFGKSKVKSLEKINISTFIGLALVPVYVSAALSFGLLFLLIIGQGLAQEHSKSSTLNETFNLGVTSLVIKGSLGDNASETKTAIDQMVGSSLGAMGYILMKLFGLAFLWMAVMAALKTSELTKSIIQPFEELGNKVGKFAMESPKYIPIPGTNIGGKQVNFDTLIRGVDKGITGLQYKNENQSSEIAKFFGGKKDETLDEVRKITATGAEGIKQFNDGIKRMTYEGLSSSTQAREELSEKIGKFGLNIDNKILEALKGANTPGAVKDALIQINDASGKKLLNGNSVESVIGTSGTTSASESSNNENGKTGKGVGVGDIFNVQQIMNLNPSDHTGSAETFLIRMRKDSTILTPKEITDGLGAINIRGEDAKEILKIMEEKVKHNIEYKGLIITEAEKKNQEQLVSQNNNASGRGKESLQEAIKTKSIATQGGSPYQASPIEEADKYPILNVPNSLDDDGGTYTG